MLQAFLKNSLIYTLGHVLTSGIAIFLLPIYTRYLSPAEYGVIDLFIVIAAIVNLTIALEISQGIARYYQEAKNEKEKTEYTSSAFWFTVLSYLLFLFLCLIFSETLTFWLLGDINKKKCVSTCCLCDSNSWYLLFYTRTVKVANTTKR